jgi:Reverse transcriptase (RNA-dependent DNA polymerase)
MSKEIKQHNDNKNWELVKRIGSPKDVRILPSVWAMRRKRDVYTGEIRKWKARINVDGSKQTEGIDYGESFAPVASCLSIRLILLFAALNKWTTKQLDFDPAFPQATVEKKLYISIPKGCETEGENDDWALKVLNNIYGH